MIRKLQALSPVLLAKPAIVLDRQLSKGGSDRLPVALMGKTYCKVDARYS
jgi:hypothetical protein